MEGSCVELEIQRTVSLAKASGEEEVDDGPRRSSTFLEENTLFLSIDSSFPLHRKQSPRRDVVDLFEGLLLLFARSSTAVPHLESSDPCS